MESTLSQYKVGFAAIIFWDFVSDSDEEELLTTLSEIYGEDVNEYSGPYMGGGGWYHRVAGNQTNEIEAREEFASVRTLVESNTNGILDVTTFAILSEEQIEMVLNSEHRNGLNQLQSTITDYLEGLPSLVDYEQAGHCGVNYAEWSGQQSLLPEGEDVDTEEIMDRLEDAHPVLYPFGFQTGGNLSLVSGNIFLSPTTTMQPYDGLAAIRRDSHPQSKPMDDLITPPPWYSEVSSLRRYYRLHMWANYRLRKLRNFDSKINDARDSISSLSSTQIDIEEVLSISDQIQALQSEYTGFQTRYNAEYQDFQDDFSQRVDEDTGPFGVPYDMPLPRPNKPGSIEQSDDTSNSAIEYFEENSDYTLEQVNQLYTRITQNIESLVSSIESRTRLAATDENLTLQNQVARLTVALTALTVILVILTVVLVMIEMS